MGVERITESKQVISILSLEDQQLNEWVLEPMGISLVEWVQFLETHITEYDKFGMWGSLKEGKIEKYLIILNAIARPISSGCLLFYQNFFKDRTEYKENEPLIKSAFDEAREWARSIGASQIEGIDPERGLYSELGFISGGTVISLAV